VLPDGNCCGGRSANNFFAKKFVAKKNVDERIACGYSANKFVGKNFVGEAA